MNKSPLLTCLLRKRALLRKQLADALAAPASYSIQGSYSESTRPVEDIRRELEQLDQEIVIIVNGTGPALTYPRYV